MTENLSVKIVFRKTPRESLTFTQRRSFNISRLNINSINYGPNASAVKEVYMKKSFAPTEIALSTIREQNCKQI